MRFSTYDLTVNVRTSRKGNKVYDIIKSSAVNKTNGTVMESSVELVVSPSGDIISKEDMGWEIIYV